MTTIECTRCGSKIVAPTAEAIAWGKDHDGRCARRAKLREKMPFSPPQKRLASIEAAAEHFDVSTKTIRRWIANGSLTAYRMGPRLIRVDLAELDMLLRPIGGTGTP